MKTLITIEIAREIAARIWCDPIMLYIQMDPALAEEIAKLLASRSLERIDK